MVMLYNPFTRKEHANYPGVVVPLAPSPERRLSTASRTSSPQREKKTDPDEKTTDQADQQSLDRSETGLGNVPTSGPLTLEALKAEVEADLSPAALESSYERTFWSCQLMTSFLLCPRSPHGVR